MSEYCERYGCKQFLRGKPIRFGFKNWCGTTTLDYLVLFDPYQERKATSPMEESSLGLGGDLVFSFADVLQSQEQKEFHLCFDNFFTSVKLVLALKEKFIKARTTLRECRTEKCPLVASNDMKKLPRGSFDYKTYPENGVIVCKWNDNSVVNLCSNAVRIQPISIASRFSFAPRKRMRIQQPFLVKAYNEYMGGCGQNGPKCHKISGSNA